MIGGNDAPSHRLFGEPGQSDYAAPWEENHPEMLGKNYLA